MAREGKAARYKLEPNLPGEANTAEPPVTMPNTEVKCRDADGSAAYDGARVGNHQASPYTKRNMCAHNKAPQGAFCVSSLQYAKL